MWKIVYDKVTQILGDNLVLVVVGGILAVSLVLWGQQNLMTVPGFASEKEKITAEIQTVCKDGRRSDLLIEYKVLEMEEARIKQQQWSLEDRMEQEAIQPSLSQQRRIYEMDKQLDKVRQRKLDIQKELAK